MQRDFCGDFMNINVPLFQLNCARFKVVKKVTKKSNAVEIQKIKPTSEEQLETAKKNIWATKHLAV